MTKDLHESQSACRRYEVVADALAYEIVAYNVAA